MDFCFNCGATVPVGSNVCPRCGAPVNNKNSKKKGFPIVGTIVAIVLAAAVIFTSVILCKGAGAFKPEYAVEKYMKANYVEFDADLAASVYHPDRFKAMCDDNDMTKNEMLDHRQESLDDVEEGMNDVNAEVTWEIVDIDGVEDEDYDDIVDFYDEEYGLDVKDIKVVEVDAVYDSDEKLYEKTFEFVVVKIGGKWYFDGEF